MLAPLEPGMGGLWSSALHCSAISAAPEKKALTGQASSRVEAQNPACPSVALGMLRQTEVGAQKGNLNSHSSRPG